jgi:hypothetical protein
MNLYRQLAPYPTGLASCAGSAGATSMSPSSTSTSSVRACSSAALRSALAGNSCATMKSATDSLCSVTVSWQPPVAASALHVGSCYQVTATMFTAVFSKRIEH